MRPTGREFDMLGLEILLSDRLLAAGAADKQSGIHPLFLVLPVRMYKILSICFFAL